MRMAFDKTTIPLFKRVVVFLGLFVLISGLIGPRIIDSDLLYRDGFAIYGGLGKALLFGLLAFVLLVRHKGFSLTLERWRSSLLFWIGGAAVSYMAAWMGVGKLLADERTLPYLLIAHGGLIVSVILLAIGCFGLPDIKRLYAAYKRECGLAIIIAGLFYVFLIGVYALWKPLAAAVLYSAQWLLSVSGVQAEIHPPITLLLDKFGVTVAQSCSGIESIALFTGLYIIVGLLDWHKLHTARYIWMLPVALLLLFALNILRVYLLILAGYFINPEIAFSLFHTYAGMVFFIIYSVIFWAVAYKFLLRNPAKK